jgi:hypothetical protein
MFITNSPMAEPVEAAEVKLSFGSVMQQTVGVHCHSNNVDLGLQTIGSSIGWYTFTIPNLPFCIRKWHILILSWKPRSVGTLVFLEARTELPQLCLVEESFQESKI